MTAVHAPPADGLQRAYDAWAPILVRALAPHLSGPEIERPPETNLTFYDRLFARLIDDLGLTGPLVFAYLTPAAARSARGAAPRADRHEQPADDPR